jgi:hypothetical protein
MKPEMNRHSITESAMHSRSAYVFDAEELDALHQWLLTKEILDVDDDMRLLIEERWPEFLSKLLPPRDRMH